MSTRRVVIDGGTDQELQEAAAEIHEEPYQVKYRPVTLGNVIGQDEVVRSLEKALTAKSRQHTYFFTGPTGTGKTTLARIAATAFGCRPQNIIEVDAASESGIDDMRKVTEGLRYQGFGDTPNKAYIVDECHGLSKQAWDSLLKSTEEPPAHVFFFFCSTNPGKIPATMLTRGPQYALQSVRYDDLMDLLEAVCKAEDLNTPESILGVCARACNGSPRQALVMLAMVEDVTDPGEAEIVVQGAVEQPEVIDLCRAMIKGDLRWDDVVRRLAPLKDLSNEGIRLQICAYLSAVLIGGARSPEAVLDMLAAFSQPCVTPNEKLAPILLAFGRFAQFGRR